MKQPAMKKKGGPSPNDVEQAIELAFDALLSIALDQFFVHKLSLPRSSVLQTEMTKDVKLEFGEASIEKKWLVLNVH